MNDSDNNTTQETRGAQNTIAEPDGVTAPTHQGEESFGWWIKLVVRPALLLAAGLLLIVALGAAQRLGWISAGGGGGHQQASPAGANVRYICPMMCTPPQTEPGRCPVCAMELVPAASGGGTGDERSIQVDPAARRVANIHTVAVKAVPLTCRIRGIGELSYDEGTLKTISAYVAGRLDRLYADYTGIVVQKGDHLALLYSPQLYSSQVELLLAKQARDDSQSVTLPRVIQSRRDLYNSARQRLIEFGITELQLAQLERAGVANSRMHLCAPVSGTVIEKLAVEGQYVKTGQAIYRLADLSTVWLMLELFPEDAAVMRYGQKVEAEVQSLPGRKFTGRVAFIDPTVNPKTRTVGVRVVMSNEGGLLRIGDYAKATIDVQLGSSGESLDRIYDPELVNKWIGPRHPHVIESSPGNCRVCGVPLVHSTEFGFTNEPTGDGEALVVPRNAVLMAGGNSVVYVETDPGRFEIRLVVLGPSTGDEIAILQGVKEGEQVASRGNFLIDSQMQLAGNPSLIDPSRAKAKKKDGPLELEKTGIELIAGEAGADLERLYQAYFAVQATLAADKAVPQEQSQTLGEMSGKLSQAPDLNHDLKSLVETIAAHSKDLHVLEMDQARIEFKPISKSIILLAARARGEGAQSTFIHFYCPMVKGGQGDWLQPSMPLANPYWGSKMLRCGKTVNELSPLVRAYAGDPEQADGDGPGRDRATRAGGPDKTMMR